MDLEERKRTLFTSLTATVLLALVEQEFALGQPSSSSASCRQSSSPSPSLPGSSPGPTLSSQPFLQRPIASSHRPGYSPVLGRSSFASWVEQGRQLAS